MVDLSAFSDVFGSDVPLTERLAFIREITGEYDIEGFTGAQELADLRANDFHIQTQLFYLERRVALGEQNVYDTVRYFPNSYTPSDLDLGIGELPPDVNYRFIIRTTIINPLTGEAEYDTHALDLNSYGSIGDLKQQGEEYIKQYYQQYANQEVTITIYKGIRQE